MSGGDGVPGGEVLGSWSYMFVSHLQEAAETNGGVVPLFGTLRMAPNEGPGLEL